MLNEQEMFLLERLCDVLDFPRAVCDPNLPAALSLLAQAYAIPEMPTAQQRAQAMLNLNQISQQQFAEQWEEYGDMTVLEGVASRFGLREGNFAERFFRMTHDMGSFPFLFPQSNDDPARLVEEFNTKLKVTAVLKFVGIGGIGSLSVVAAVPTLEGGVSRANILKGIQDAMQRLRGGGSRVGQAMVTRFGVAGIYVAGGAVAYYYYAVDRMEDIADHLLFEYRLDRLPIDYYNNLNSLDDYNIGNGFTAEQFNPELIERYF